MSSVGETVITVAAGLVMLVGLAGVVLPVLPGLGLVWAAALGYGLVVGWGELGPWLFGLITILGTLGMAADVWMTAAGAKAGRASGWAIVSGLAGAVIGMLVFNIPGAVIGLLAGVTLFEYFRLRDWRQAANAAAGTAAGCGMSFGVKIVLGVGMIAAWLAWVWLG